MDTIKTMSEKKLWESLHSIEDEIKAAEDKIRHLRKIHEELTDEINGRQNYDDMYAGELLGNKLPSFLLQSLQLSNAVQYC